MYVSVHLHILIIDESGILFLLVRPGPKCGCGIPCRPPCASHTSAMPNFCHVKVVWLERLPLPYLRIPSNWHNVAANQLFHESSAQGVDYFPMASVHDISIGVNLQKGCPRTILSLCSSFLLIQGKQTQGRWVQCWVVLNVYILMPFVCLKEVFDCEWKEAGYKKLSSLWPNPRWEFQEAKGFTTTQNLSLDINACLVNALYTWVFIKICMQSLGIRTYVKCLRFLWII